MNLTGLLLLSLLVPPCGPQAERDVRGYVISLQEKTLTIRAESQAGSSTKLMEIMLEAAEAPGGAAVWNDRLVITLPKSSALLICSLREKKLLSRQSLPDFPSPRGAAYDPEGHLWMLSANSLAEIQFTPDGHFNPIHHRGDFSDPRHLLILPDGYFYIAENGAPAAVKILDSKLSLLETIPLQQPATGLQICPTGEIQCLFEKEPPRTLKSPPPPPIKAPASKGE